MAVTAGGAVSSSQVERWTESTVPASPPTKSAEHKEGHQDDHS
jgi:hypothetical protein